MEKLCATCDKPVKILTSTINGVTGKGCEDTFFCLFCGQLKHYPMFIKHVKNRVCTLCAAGKPTTF